VKLDLSIPFEAARAKAYLDGLIVRKAKIELKEYKKARTSSQNRYLHVLFTFIGNELGYTDHEAKTTMKRYFANDGHDWAKYNKGKEWFLKSTADYTTEEMTIFVDWIRNFSLINLNSYLPTPDEYFMDTFGIEKQLGT